MTEWRQYSFIRLVLSGLFLAALSACGGGGGGPGFVGGGDDGGGGDGGVGVAEVGLTLTDSGGAATNVITASSPATLTVTLTGADGSPAANEIATVNTTLATVLPTSSILTDDQGVAVFQLVAGADSGADTVSVTFEGTTTSLSYEVDSQLSVTLTDSAGNPITIITNAVSGVITVTSSDSQGVPIEGDLITAVTTVGSISPATRLTNASGVAAFVLAAGAQSGAGTVSVTAGNRAASVNFEIVSATAGSNVLSLSLTDGAGTAITNITSISPGVLTVTASDAFGQPLANEILSAQSTVGEISPDSGSTLTNSSGQGVFTLLAGDTLGAGTVTVTQGAVSQSLNFQVGEANLRVGRFSGSTFIEGEIEAGATSLPAAGSTPLSVSVVDSDGNPVTSAVPVQFNSGCANLDPPLADLTAEVNTINGVATATYTASGCTGTDIVTAAIVQGNSQAATVNLNIATADINSVAFVGALPTTIALRGTGGAGRSETSAVSFRVLDTTGAPAPGVNVDFSLSTTVGGLSLTNPTATTNSGGVAQAIVQAGDVSTSVRVTATIDVSGVLLSTVSDQLVVSTGLPDQNSISLSGTLNPGGGNLDGIISTLTVRMADKFNNPVPDGTVAFFTTEYGAVVDSCVLSGGECTVDWVSQEPRFPLISNSSAFISSLDNRTCGDTGTLGIPCASSLGPIFGLRSQVVVIAVGEESFIDVNGNGVFDVGEPFEDLPEAFLDKNENGVFDNTSPLCTIDSGTIAGRECANGREEIFFDFDEDGVYDAGNGLYNGSLCPQALAAAGQCTQDLLHVRSDLTIVMSGEQEVALLETVGLARFPVTTGITMVGGGSDRTFEVVVADQFNNLPSEGAQVTVSAEGCEILGGERTVPDSNAVGAFRVPFTVVNQSDNTAALEGSISINVSGAVGSQELTVVVQCTDAPG